VAERIVKGVQRYLVERPFVRHLFENGSHFAGGQRDVLRCRRQWHERTLALDHQREHVDEHVDLIARVWDVHHAGDGQGDPVVGLQPLRIRGLVPHQAVRAARSRDKRAGRQDGARV